MANAGTMSPIGRPASSASVQPKSASAAGLADSIWPSASVVMIASMALSITAFALRLGCREVQTQARRQVESGDPRASQQEEHERRDEGRDETRR